MKRRIFLHRSSIDAPAERVYQWHARPGALERLSPPWDPPVVLSRTGGIEDEGARVVVRAGPMRQRWVAEHHGAVAGREFRDRQISGPFASWEHIHRMEPDGAGRCTLEDHIEYVLPGGPMGEMAAGRFVRRILERTFAYRHRVTSDDLAAHTTCHRGPAPRVAITGAGGLIGRALVPFLTTGGHDVVRFVRRTAAAKDERPWNPETGAIDAAGIEGVDAVVHLAGENIAEGRWTEARKRRLRDSRIRPTRRLAEALSRLDRRPSVLIAASAVGIYGDCGDTWLTERDEAAPDFLGRLAAEWEEATEPARQAGIRVVNLRLGIVLSPAGGALSRMLTPFCLGAGGMLGSGRQYVSWIAIDDVLGVIHHVLDHPELSGPVNAVTPTPVTNAELTQALGRVLRRPTWAAAPAFALRLAFGEMADAALLASTRVRPERLVATGYRFRFPEIEGALRHLLGRA